MFQKRLLLYFTNTFKQISKGGVMKRIASVLILLTSTALFAQDFNLHSLYHKAEGDTNQWNTSSGSRGIWSGTDLDKDGRVSQSEQLRYNDETMKGEVFKEWKAFNHPTLGKVEIGGWKKFGQNNPLPPALAKEVERNVDFMLMQARSTPLLAITDVQ